MNCPVCGGKMIREKKDVSYCPRCEEYMGRRRMKRLREADENEVE